MFQNRLRGEYLHWYLNSPHKDRIEFVGEALITKDYQFAVVENHLREWIRLSRYLSDHNISLPATVFSKEIQDYLRICFPKLSKSRMRGIRAGIRIFLETDKYGNFPRRMKIQKSPPSHLYQQWALPYFQYLRCCRNLAESTLRHHELLLKKFTIFLRDSGVNCTEDLTHRIILDSFTNLDGWRQATLIKYASVIRGFLRWGYAENLFPQDLSGAVITVRRYYDAKIPDVLSEEEIDRILFSVNRDTPLGKRNYAILLMAACYGLRPSDIRHLSLENIRWREGVIELTQSKTTNPLILPLLEDVTNALIEYLKVRPPTDNRKIFIRHLAPYEPFSENNNLADIMQSALDQAGMQGRKGLRGLYLFRHSLATRLLREGNSINSIADVLGHSDVSSTFIYTKVDLDRLRTVAISIKEVLS